VIYTEKKDLEKVPPLESRLHFAYLLLTRTMPDDDGEVHSIDVRERIRENPPVFANLLGYHSRSQLSVPVPDLADDQTNVEPRHSQYPTTSIPSTIDVRIGTNPKKSDLEHLGNDRT
jgi:hypothetical protein